MERWFRDHQDGGIVCEILLNGLRQIPTSSIEKQLQPVSGRDASPWQREETRLTPIAITLAHDISDGEFAGLCKSAKLLRITQIVVPSSPLGTPFNSEIDRLKQLLKVSKLDVIRMAIKTEAGRLSKDAHTSVELCQSVKGLGFDLVTTVQHHRPAAATDRMNFLKSSGKANCCAPE